MLLYVNSKKFKKFISPLASFKYIDLPTKLHIKDKTITVYIDGAGFVLYKTFNIENDITIDNEKTIYFYTNYPQISGAINKLKAKYTPVEINQDCIKIAGIDISLDIEPDKDNNNFIKQALSCKIIQTIKTKLPSFFYYFPLSASRYSVKEEAYIVINKNEIMVNDGKSMIIEKHEGLDNIEEAIAYNIPEEIYRKFNTIDEISLLDNKHDIKWLRLHDSKNDITFYVRESNIKPPKYHSVLIDQQKDTHFKITIPANLLQSIISKCIEFPKVLHEGVNVIAIKLDSKNNQIIFESGVKINVKVKDKIESDNTVYFDTKILDKLINKYKLLQDVVGKVDFYIPKTEDEPIQIKNDEFYYLLMPIV